MTIGLRAAWRLLRCVVHALHGLGVVLLRFGTLDAAGRHARIRWWSAKMLRVLGVICVIGWIAMAAVNLVRGR